RPSRQPNSLPSEARYVLPSAGMLSGRCCGPQRSGAPSSVGILVLGLRCSWCPGNAPMPVLIGLHALPPSVRWRGRDMPVEFLHGRPLSPEELEMIRQQIEEGFDNIAEVDPEIRGIVARNWPHLLEKLPPEED